MGRGYIMSLRRLGILIPPITDHDRDMMVGVLKYIRDFGGWEAATRNSNPFLPWEGIAEMRTDPWELVRQLDVDGVVAGISGLEQYGQLLSKGIPVVSVYGRFDLSNIAYVISNNIEIGRQVAKYLVSKGLKHFSCILRSGRVHYQQRYEGFNEEIHKQGYHCEKIELDEDLHDIDAIQMISHKLQTLQKPAGCFATYDSIAVAVAHACKIAKIDIPDQVSIIGVSNHTILCDSTNPPISSIRQRSEDIGYEAARLLDLIVKGEKRPNERVLIPPGTIVERRSSNFLAINDPIVVKVVRYIREHANERISIEQVMDIVPVSRRTLDKKFMNELGRTPAYELRLARVRLAQERLIASDEPITAIALDMGFNSVSGFNRAFKEYVGMTPTEYRSHASKD